MGEMNDFSQQIEFLQEHSTYARRWLSARPEWLEWLRVCGLQKIDIQGVEDLLVRRAQILPLPSKPVDSRESDPVAGSRSIL